MLQLAAPLGGQAPQQEPAGLADPLAAAEALLRTLLQREALPAGDLQQLIERLVAASGSTAGAPAAGGDPGHLTPGFGGGFTGGSGTGLM